MMQPAEGYGSRALQTPAAGSHTDDPTMAGLSSPATLTLILPQDVGVAP